MRKILLASTALVAMGVSAASADISLSGSAKFTYNSWSTSATVDGATGANTTSTSLTNDLTISSSFASDNGLTYGTSHSIDESSTADGQSMYVKGSFGEIRFGGDGADAAFDTSADVADGELNKSSAAFTGAFDGDSAVADADGIAYFTPSINGFAAGFSTEDAGSSSKADKTGYGASYSQEVAGASVKLAYAVSETADNETDLNNGVTATSVGLTITMGDATVTIAQNTKKDDESSYDHTGTGIGISYAAMDGLTLKAHSKSADDSKDAQYDSSEVAASVTYTVAPGLTANVAYTDSSFTTDGGAKTTGSATTAYLKVAF